MGKTLMKILIGIGLVGLSSIGISKTSKYFQKKISQQLNLLSAIIKKEFLGDLVILDSNIWMSSINEENFINFIIELCKENRLQIFLPSFQLIEFQNPKDDNDRFLKKLAKERIEILQDSNILIIENFNQKFSYVDDSLLDYMIYKSRNCSKFSFITEDRELRIKAKSITELKEILIVSKKKDFSKYQERYMSAKDLIKDS